MTERSSDNQRGRPFRKGESGNPTGRPSGARNRATLAAEALLDGEAEGLTRKAIELARSGDIAALRLCLERILPARRERLVQFELPPLKRAYDAPIVLSAIIHAVAQREITISEAAELVKFVEAFVRAIEKSNSTSEDELQHMSDEELERRVLDLQRKLGYFPEKGCTS